MSDQPTKHGPGSEGKIKVLAERFESGLPLWHDGDAMMCSREPGYLIKAGERGRHVSTEPGIVIHEGGCE